MTAAADLVCPACKGELQGSPAELRCTVCGRRYPRDADADSYDLRCEDLLGPDRARWIVAQDLGLATYRARPESNCSRWLGEGRYAHAFGEFCRLSGRVLDIGCGPYGPYRLDFSDPETEYVGIDPLPATAPDFATYRGIAEYLPFRDGSFDHAILVSSLDHVVDPLRALSEARRVLRPDGRLHVWTHVHPPPTRLMRRVAVAGVRRLLEPRRWSTLLQSGARVMRTLRRPTSEPDEHHLRLLGPNEARALMTAAGLGVDRSASYDGHIFFLGARRSP